MADFPARGASIEVRDDILGGEPVFPGTRIAVRHIGGMLARGATAAEVREDYPDLTDRDLELAHRYVAQEPPHR